MYTCFEVLVLSRVMFGVIEEALVHFQMGILVVKNLTAPITDCWTIALCLILVSSKALPLPQMLAFSWHHLRHATQQSDVTHILPIEIHKEGTALPLPQI